MDAPVYKKLVDLDNHIENPFETPTGQLPVSMNENFMSRLWREGVPVQIFTNGLSVPSATNTKVASTTTSLGKDFIPLCISISCDQDAILQIVWTTGLVNTGYNSQGVWYETLFCKAGTPFIRNLQGEIKIPEGLGLNVYVNPTTTGKAYVNIYGIEVISNA